KDDKVQVALLVPDAKRTEAEFQMPKIVPGTYAIYDFGRFISDFKAYDAKGKELSVKRLDDNRWQIESPKQLHKITYWVEDTFDTDKDNFVFEPGGTNIEEGKNFTINTYGFFGYLKDEKEVPFEVQIKRPANFYGATSLERIKTAQNTDTYRIDNYFNLSDMPIMYCEPDTTSLAVGGAEVMVAVYSPNKMLTAQEVMSNVKELLLAQKAYLGGTLPVDKYTFLIYLNEGVGKSGSFGALEHSYSTLFFLIENKAQALTQTIRDVAAHEFFHIVTPLNIHSEQIGNYDFINPQMSKHLWLYEGGTEYAAQHVQVKHGLYDTEAFLNDLTTKMRTADRIGTPVSFTEMSKGCLDKYEEYYGDVYAKGALLNMLLDIQLRKLSEGKYGVQEMMRDLAEKYGKDRSFKDDALFD
ncbi:MAG: peptidase M61, partial [Bacteroidota bacterium]